MAVIRILILVSISLSLGESEPLAIERAPRCDSLEQCRAEAVGASRAEDQTIPFEPAPPILQPALIVRASPRPLTSVKAPKKGAHFFAHSGSSPPTALDRLIKTHA